MGCRKEEEDRFWGRLGSEAGYSQAAPVLIWRYRPQDVILAKKTKQTNMQLTTHAFHPEKKPANYTGQTPPTKKRQNTVSTPAVHACSVNSLKSLICQQHFHRLLTMWIYQIHWRWIEHASQWDTQLAAANGSATSSGVCFARNAVFSVEPNINQTSTQDEVNGEDLQQEKAGKWFDFFKLH